MPSQFRDRGVSWRRGALMAGALAVVTLAAQTATPASAQAVGGEVIVIDSVTVGGSFVADVCGSGQPVLPMTIVATFINFSGDHLPTGPYATGEWTGGFGSLDDHFGTGEAHDITQTFHVLLTASNAYTGPGEYSAFATVQDVGLAGGFATATVTATVGIAPPYGAAPPVKCPTVRQLNTGADFGKAALKAVLKEVLKKACPLCAKIQSAYGQVTTYGTVLIHALKRLAQDDPPDDNFQRIADPSPPPLPPPPSGLTSAQVAALTSLESLLATGIADVSGMQTSQDRMWGAGNADSGYWYQVQARSLAGFAAKTSAVLSGLPAAYAAMQAAFAKQVPAFAITPADVARFVSLISNGLPSDIAAGLTKLGQTPGDQRQILQDLLGIDESQLTDPHAGADLFAEPADFAGDAAAIATLGRWASALRQQQPPVVTGLSAASGPTSGGTTLTVEGSNLKSVTGISFGPSTPTEGLGGGLSCGPESCTVTVPPGTGTVDVTASGPGGPSVRTAADKFTYVTPAKPTVTRIFPATGSSAGGTSVEVFGAGLSGGSMYFGPTLASDWSCSDTLCTATAPASTSTSPIDVQVVTAAGTSSPVAGDRFTYIGSPPPPPAPVVTGVSPTSGSVYGGDQLTITGSGFTGATEVDIGGSPIEGFTVVADSHITLTTTTGNWPPGTSDVTVITPAGVSAVSAADHYTFVAGGPAITTVSPGTGPTTGGTPVTVTGTHLNGASLGFGSQQASDAVCGPTSCTVTSPPEATGLVDVQATQSDGSMSALSAADHFTYTLAPVPVITSVEPSSGSTAGGALVSILGRNLAGGTVTIGGQPAQDNANPFSTCSQTWCTVNTPAAARPGSVAVVVTRPDGKAAKPTAYDYVLPGPPIVTAVEPSSGWLSSTTQVLIFGQNLADTTGITFGGNPVAPDDIEQCTQDECTVDEKGGTRAGLADVLVTTPLGTSAPTSADHFTFLQPTITSMSPTRGLTVGGTPMTVTGTDLATATIGFNIPGFGITTGNNWQCTDTRCTGPLPDVIGIMPGGGRVDVVASAGDVLSPTTSRVTAADNFTYKVTPKPVVTGVSPNSGTDTGGDLVTVTGNYLTGGTMAFGGSGVTTSCTQTKCTGLSAGSFGDGPADVTVQTASGISAKTAADKFTYHKPGAPSVSGVSPAAGPAGGGTRVVISGANLTGGIVHFGATPAAAVTCTAATSCSAVSPTGAVGTVDVTVTTVAGTSPAVPTDGFTYQKPPQPKVTAISPATGPRTGGTSVTVTGTNLLAGTVSFGATAASDSACTQSTCTATQPPGSAGTVDVTVHTAGGTSATSAADTFTVSPVQVSEVPIPGLAVGDAAGGGHVYAARDGTTWFTMPTLDEVGHIATDGTMTIFTAPDPQALPVGITQTADGQVWYTEENTDKLVSIASGGQQTVHDLPGHAHDVRDVTVGPDGRLWMTLAQSAAILAITTGGTATIYHLPNPVSYPLNIVTGPDGRLWFTERDASAIGAITTSGELTEYPLPQQGLQPWGICVGPDGRLWFAEVGSANLGAISTDGAVTQYPLPTVGTTTGIASGPDGRLWFTRNGSDELGALNPATGVETDYPLPPHETFVQPNYLAMSSDGTLWATEFHSYQMVRLTKATLGVAPSVTSVSPRYGPPAGGTQVTVSGANLSGATSVLFGSKPATLVTDVEAGHVLAQAPAGTGTVDITVVTPQGTTAVNAADVYHYGTPPPAPPVVTAVRPTTGSTSGGDKVTLSGSGLAGATVRFGAMTATSSSCTDTSCTVTSPAGTAGHVNVTATTVAGTSATSPGDVFTYLTPPPPAPTVTGVSPAKGPFSGGNTVTVSGTHLAGGTVTFGLIDVPAKCTATACIAIAPSGGVGVVNLHVITAGGTSGTTAADRYTYLGAPPAAPGRPSARAAGATSVTVSWTPPGPAARRSLATRCTARRAVPVPRQGLPIARSPG